MPSSGPVAAEPTAGPDHVRQRASPDGHVEPPAQGQPGRNQPHHNQPAVPVSNGGGNQQRACVPTPSRFWAFLQTKGGVAALGLAALLVTFGLGLGLGLKAVHDAKQSSCMGRRTDYLAVCQSLRVSDTSYACLKIKAHLFAESTQCAEPNVHILAGASASVVCTQQQAKRY